MQMNDANRNYNTITTEEKKLWDELKDREVVFINGKPSALRKSLYNEYPKAVRHFLSLFPNHFLDRADLISEMISLQCSIEEFEVLLERPSTTEREILNFIKNKNAYFIIASILKKGYMFGHHSLFVIPEFQLTINHKPDFVIIGQNSDGYHFVFVELEGPSGSITKQDGSYGETIRKGISQIDDWEIWLERNFSHLKPVFDGKKKPLERLPDEFFEFDKTRMHYVVIAGKRIDYTEHTRRLNRKNLDERKLSILHYDNLIDLAKEVLSTKSY